MQDNKYIGNFGCKYIAESHVLTKLQTLNLSGNFSNEGCKFLASASQFIHLRDLDVSRNDNIEEEGYVSLKTSSHLEKCKIYM